jgi:C1A family cysteine protease
MVVMLPRRTLLTGSAAALAGAWSALAHAQSASPAALASRRGFGWIRDLPDPQDRLLGAPPFAIAQARPATVDLSGKLPPAYDQGQLNSCSANAIAGAVQFARRAHNKPGDFIPSRLFIYYQERKTEQTLSTDFGARLRDGISAVAKLGVCPETDWPYDGIAGDPTTGVFPPNAGAIKTPTAAQMGTAARYAAISYRPLAQNQKTLESCLASGYPFVFGFTVFTNLTDTTTYLRVPGAGDTITPEGHAVLAVGYDQARRVFRIRNSWGPADNDHGHFDMDYDYVLNADLCSDFWVIYQTLGLM